MLEDPGLQNIVSWGPKGDCFVVKVRFCPFVRERKLMRGQGHERIHNSRPPTLIQTFEFRKLRTSTE